MYPAHEATSKAISATPRHVYPKYISPVPGTSAENKAGRYLPPPLSPPDSSRLAVWYVGTDARASDSGRPVDTMEVRSLNAPDVNASLDE
jgi:hypothetical protein